MTMMMAETTWALLAGAVGDGSLRKAGGGGVMPE
jgi:hypothetical protein